LKIKMIFQFKRFFRFFYSFSYFGLTLVYLFFFFNRSLWFFFFFFMFSLIFSLLFIYHHNNLPLWKNMNMNLCFILDFENFPRRK
jgi:hypothetical protein